MCNADFTNYCPLVPGYSVTQEVDHSGDDLAHHPNTDPADLASLCDNLSHCVSFNWQPNGVSGWMKSGGWLKSGASIDNQGWGVIYSTPQLCFYAACELTLFTR